MQNYEILVRSRSGKRNSVVILSGMIGVKKNGMQKPLVTSLFVSAALLVSALNGCSTSSATVQSQIIHGVAWLPDESGLLVYIDKITLSNIDGSQTEGANLYHADANGTIGNPINGSDVALSGVYYLPSSPLVFISPDGQTAITQFGSGIYSVGVQSGTVNNIIQQTGLLGVSLDFKYAATTNTPGGAAATIVTLYNLSSSSPLLMLPRKTVPNLVSIRALWVSNDRYAVTIKDSVVANNDLREHIEIFDTDGNALFAIPDGDVSISAAAFSPGSNDLFFRTNNFWIDRVNLTTMKRDTIIRDSVESVSASNDGAWLAYVSMDSVTSGNLYSFNVADGNKSLLASGMVQPTISPNADKVACTTQNSTLNVFQFTKPQ